MNPGTKAVLINFGFTLLGAAIGIGTTWYFSTVKILKDHRRGTVKHLQQELKDNTNKELFSKRALGDYVNYPFPPLTTSALNRFVDDFSILKMKEESLKQRIEDLKIKIRTFNDHVRQLNIEIAVATFNPKILEEQKEFLVDHQREVNEEYKEIKNQMLKLLNALDRNYTSLVKKGRFTKKER
jgi:hypothetical protein